MSENTALAELSRAQLQELIQIYCKDWLAMDGVWFQHVARTWGRDAAMD